MSLIIDGTNGITFNNSTVQASAGQVLQVVNATYGTYVSTASSTLTDTGLTATITPKFSTSKILVIASLNGAGKTNLTAAHFALFRNSTNIKKIDDLVGYTGASSANLVGSSVISYLDSPSTTSATIYKIQFASSQNVANAYLNNYWADAGSITSTITLMEIAG